MSPPRIAPAPGAMSKMPSRARRREDIASEHRHELCVGLGAKGHDAEDGKKREKDRRLPGECRPSSMSPIELVLPLGVGERECECRKSSSARTDCPRWREKAAVGIDQGINTPPIDGPNSIEPLKTIW